MIGTWMKTFSCSRIAAIAYHEISGGAGKHKYAMSVGEFRRQIALLLEVRMRSVTIGGMWELMSDEGIEGSGRLVLVTFDDGHISQYDAGVSILDRQGIWGTFFITTDWIGTTGYMERLHLLDLHKMGMSVQSHGRSHRYLDSLDTVGLREELGGSKRVLEDIIGEEVWCVSFPGGRYNERVVDVGQELGFRGFVSSDPYQVRRSDRCLMVGRVMMKGGMRDEVFRQIVECCPERVRKERIVWETKRALRRWIGREAYGWLWRLYVGK
jgi:peptidoglycan/xylan/chitin deacetylase (PgdA/CDA1 family)